MGEHEHSPERVEAAFAAAPRILRRLEVAGVEHPRFELFVDGSGSLVLGRRVTSEQFDLACSLVRSRRLAFHRADDLVAIDFCDGLLAAVEAREKEVVGGHEGGGDG